MWKANTPLETIYVGNLRKNEHIDTAKESTAKYDQQVI